jgi:ATP-dependent DNA helicase RecQ
VLHDTSLEALCRARPKSIAELRGVTGFGERKTERYGAQVLAALECFRNGARAENKPPMAASVPLRETLKLLRAGQSLEQIAAVRGRQLSTILDTVAQLIERGEAELNPEWLPAGRAQAIEDACRRVGVERLRPIKDVLPEDISFGDIRLVVASLRRKADMAITAAAPEQSAASQSV